MIIVTTDTIANQNIVEVKGLVTSSIVQSRNIGKDILSGLKSVIGGELKNYTQMLEDSKKAVRERLVNQAEEPWSKRDRRSKVRTVCRPGNLRTHRIWYGCCNRLACNRKRRRRLSLPPQRVKKASLSVSSLYVFESDGDTFCR